MENGQSKGVLSRGISKMANVLGIVYTVSVIAAIVVPTMTPYADDAIFMKSWLRFTYITFFLYFVGLILWISSISLSESGFMAASLIFYGLPMVYWMNDIFFGILYYLTTGISYGYKYDPSLHHVAVVLTAVFFMAFYFVLMTCYSSLKNTYTRNTSEQQQFDGGFDWTVAGFAVSLVMFAFIVGATRFCSALPSGIVYAGAIGFGVVNIGITIVWWLGVVNAGRKRMLTSLIFWFLFFSILIILEIYASCSLEGFLTGGIYFTAGCFVALYIFAVMTYISIMKAKLSGVNKRLNLDYSMISNGNKELHV